MKTIRQRLERFSELVQPACNEHTEQAFFYAYMK